MAENTTTRHSMRLFSKKQTLQVSAPAALTPPPKKKKKKTPSEANKEYMNRLKQDPVRYSQWQERNKDRCREYRKNADDATKERWRAESRRRVAESRARKKAAAVLDTSISRPRTRQDEEEKKLQREMRREAKRKQRENMTPQKRRWVNEKKRIQRAKAKEEKLAKQMASLYTSSQTQTEEDASSTPRTPAAERQALHRVKEAVPKEPAHFVDTLKQLKDKAMKSPRKRAVMQMNGINSQANETNMEAGSVLINAMHQLHNKKDGDSRQKRRLLGNIYEKYGSLRKKSKVFKVNRKTISKKQKNNVRQERQSKTEEEIVDFFDRSATVLPDQHKVSKKTGRARAVLDKPLAEVHANYKQQGGTASMSKFAQCRPKHVRLMAAGQLRQCLCEYCTNVKLKIKVINQVSAQEQQRRNRLQENQQDNCHIRHVYHAVRLSTCPGGGKACAYRQCAQCDINLLDDKLAAAKTHQGQLKWHRWSTKKVNTGGKLVSRKMLETREGSIKTLIQEFLQEMGFLSEHLYRADWQRKVFEAQRA